MATKKAAKNPARAKSLKDVAPKSRSRGVKGGGIKTMSVTNPGTAGGGGH